MTTGDEFMARLESRFSGLSAEEKLQKLVAYQQRLKALTDAGYSQEEAVAELEKEFPAASKPPENYGTIHHPRNHLLTGILYTVGLAAVLAAAALFTKLFGM